MNTNEFSSNKLERSKVIFFEIGLALTLIVAFIVFESTSRVERNPQLSVSTVQDYDVDQIPITRSPEPVLPPPPSKQITDIIEVISCEDQVPESDFNFQEYNDDDIVDVQTVETELEPEVIEEPDVPFTIVEDMPEFPGGEIALRKYIAEHIRYPELAKDNDIQGTVYLRFVVDKNGDVTDVTVVRGVDKLLDDEALRVIKSLPKFTPGKQRGKPVPVSTAVPVKFVLNY